MKFIKRNLLNAGKQLFKNYHSKITDQAIRSLPFSQNTKKSIQEARQFLSNIEIEAIDSLRKQFNIQKAKRLYFQGFDKNLKESQRKQILKDVAEDVLQKAISDRKIVNPQLLDLQNPIARTNYLNDAVTLARLAR